MNLDKNIVLPIFKANITVIILVTMTVLAFFLSNTIVGNNICEIESSKIIQKNIELDTLRQYLIEYRGATESWISRKKYYCPSV